MAGTSRILLKTLPNFFCGFIMPTHKYSQLRRKNLHTYMIIDTPYYKCKIFVNKGVRRMNSTKPVSTFATLGPFLGF